MKKFLMILFAGAVLVALGAGCEKDDPQPTVLNDAAYYVAGYDAIGATIQTDGTAKAGGYLLISANLQDTVYVHNWRSEGTGRVASDLLDDLFEFPAAIIMLNHVCGMAFFPQEYRYTYKVDVVSSRLMTQQEKDALIRVCNDMIPVSEIHPNMYVVINSIAKIE